VSSGRVEIIEEKIAWDEARNRCIDRGMDLVILNSRQEEEQVMAQFILR